MSLLCNRWCFTALIFLFSTSAAWSKSFGVEAGIITENGHVNTAWVASMFAYSALLIPVDALIAMSAIYLFGRRIKSK